MRKIFVYLIMIGAISSITSMRKINKIFKRITDLNVVPIPVRVNNILSEQKKAVVETGNYGVEKAKKLVGEIVIPISELPLYHYRAENKIHTLSELKRHGPEFEGAKYFPGTFFQKMAQTFGFYDMIDVKHVLCEFFYNSAEIVFYRGLSNFHADILEAVEKLGVLKAEDIETLEKLGFNKIGQSYSFWYTMPKYKQFIPLMGRKTDTKEYNLLSKEKVAIKKKYYELTNEIAALVWHLFHTYEEEYASRESIVHHHLKREQIAGHFMGNAFVLTMLNDTIRFYNLKNVYLGEDKLDIESLKKEIEEFIFQISYIYTESEIDRSEDRTLIKKVIQYILSKFGKVEVDDDMLALYKFKIEILVVLTKILEKSELDEIKAFKIIELCINNWKTVFYLHVSGTLTSAKPAPEFYNYHETVEEENSFANISDSDTVERDKSNSESFEITDKDEPDNPVDESEDDEDYSDFGNTVLQEKDIIVKLLEDQNPFRYLLQNSLLKVNFKMRKIREQLIRSFEIICDHLLLNDDCGFIKHSIRNINTYVLKKDGRIAGRKWCNEYVGDCSKIGPEDYMLFIRKITEIQGVSMGILEYFILKSKEKQSLENLSTQQRIKLGKDIKHIFEEYHFLRIFVTKEYLEELTNYAEGYKNSKIAKLAEARVKQIKRGIGLLTKKPPPLDVRDMDDILIPDNSK